MNLRTFINIIFSILPLILFSQPYDFPIETVRFPFINYAKNNIEIFGDSSGFKPFFSKFDSILMYGNPKLSIVHLGGSHIQADMYTQQLRRRFEEFQPGISGDRGFIFPYKIAQTNNPFNYKVFYTGSWTTCKNVDKNDSCLLGMAGISITTADRYSSVKIILNSDPALYYTFNRLKVFHPDDKNQFEVNIRSQNCTGKIRSEKMGFTEFCFDTSLDSVEIVFEQTDSLQNKFELQGFDFESDNIGGIQYNCLGVNGAKINSFLRCQLFAPQLASLHPDLVILSFGTNDGYTLRFDKNAFKNEYTGLFKLIKDVAPGAAVLITVPNDSYIYGKYANKNTEEIKNIIFEIALENGLAVWDFYSVMGGFGSSLLWYKQGLMAEDKIHFNKAGYSLNGDLLFSAFIKAWESFNTPE